MTRVYRTGPSRQKHSARRTAFRVLGAVSLSVATLAGASPAMAAEPESLLDSATAPVAEITEPVAEIAPAPVNSVLTAVASGKLGDQLKSTLGQAFGGAHYDAQLGKLVVGVTDASKFDIVRQAGAEPRLVTFSASLLDGVVDGLNQQTNRAPKGITGWYVDSSDNATVLTTKPGTLGQAVGFVRSTGVRMDAVRIVESPESPRLYSDVIGGNSYRTSAGNKCSVGFSVEGGFLTAGHCGRQGQTTTTPSGTFAGSTFPGADHAFVRVNAGETPQPLVNNYQGGTVNVAGSAEVPEGAPLCRSGATTGWHCGTVEAKNQTVLYQEGPVHGLTRTNICAEPGDSGGPFIAGDQAQGTTSGGTGDCTAGGTTYFQPINAALGAHGVRLLTR